MYHQKGNPVFSRLPHAKGGTKEFRRILMMRRSKLGTNEGEGVLEAEMADHLRRDRIGSKRVAQYAKGSINGSWHSLLPTSAVLSMHGDSFVAQVLVATGIYLFV